MLQQLLKKIEIARKAGWKNNDWVLTLEEAESLVKEFTIHIQHLENRNDELLKQVP